MPALAPRLLAIAALSLAFVGLTMLISGGVLTAFDHEVGQAMHRAWNESLHGVFQAVAELGGLELTSLLMLGLFIYLLRGGFGWDSLVVLAFAGAVALETLYKFLFFHPGPPRVLSHPDGPSITELIEGSAIGNSFPSGHVVRAVVAYGLLAFVVRRLSPSATVRAAAIPVAILVVVLVAVDRLYLDVHWQSDVVGGLLLGLIAALAGTVWLDRPRKIDN